MITVYFCTDRLSCIKIRYYYYFIITSSMDKIAKAHLLLFFGDVYLVLPPFDVYPKDSMLKQNDVISLSRKNENPIKLKIARFFCKNPVPYLLARRGRNTLPEDGQGLPPGFQKATFL